MHGTKLAFRTPPNASAWSRWLIYSALARLIIFVVLFAVTAQIVLLTLHAFGWSRATITPDVRGWYELIARVVPALTAYLILTRVVERRWPAEMDWRKLPAKFAIGTGLGIVLLSVVIGILWLTGSYHVLGTDTDIPFLQLILMFGLGAGINEEILFRGALFRIVEEGLGTWIALLVSALAFGAIHLGNPNATLWSGTAIAIEAGILFGLVYHVTRSLWVCMGLHAAWNVMEGPVFGTSVSGLPPQGLIKASLTGPDWLSGGTFGPEASLITPVCCLALASIFLVIALRRGSIVAPFWARRNERAS